VYVEGWSGALLNFGASSRHPRTKHQTWSSSSCNPFLISSAVVGGAESIFVKVADVIATAPGFISNWFFVRHVAPP